MQENGKLCKTKMNKKARFICCSIFIPLELILVKQGLAIMKIPEYAKIPELIKDDAKAILIR